MMWASLLLAGILSGWWGALALAVAPPANSGIATTTGGGNSGNDINSSGRSSNGITPSETMEHSSAEAMMMMIMTTSRSMDQASYEVGSVTSLPPTSEATTTNYDLFRHETVVPRENLIYQRQEDSHRDDDKTDVTRSHKPVGIESAEKIILQDDPPKDHDKGVERRKGILNRRSDLSIGPLLENLAAYQVTPTTIREDSYGSDQLQHERKFRSSWDGSDQDNGFEDDSELQDYSLDDEEWSRESRKFESTNSATGSVYPGMDPITHLPRHTSSSFLSTTSHWAEVFGPVIGGSVERPRVSRSAKQQRTKNRTRSDSAREQRRKCRNKGCRGRNWCPDMDVGNRAFLAPTVFEGKARSMSSLRKPGSNYAVTFEVKQVYKSQSGFQPLQKNDSVRLHFRDKVAPGKSTLCSNVANGNSEQQLQQQQQQRDNTSGMVRANIKRGKVYLVFVNRVGPRNFTILGEPVIRSKKNEQAVQAVVRPDYVREVTLSELRDSVARLRDRVKLVCRTRGSPPPRVHWLKDGVPLHPRRGLRIQHKRRRSKVVISSARQEDSGKYECVAESTSGHRASLAAQLLVAHDTRIQDTTTAAWPRQEQPCPIAGDFCMNGGTCLFFETVGEPACRCAEGFTGLRCETKDVISTGSVYNRHRAPFSCKLGLSTSYYC